MVWQKSWWSLEEGRGAELAAIERDRDPATDPGRPAVVPGPRSGSIDPGSWNAASTPFPATMLHCFFHRPELKMATLPAMPEGATALEIPSDRPAFYDSFKAFGVPAAATAVRLVTPPSERRTSRPESMSIYMPPAPPEMVYFAKRFAYAYISPATAPCRADPGAFLRLVFRTLALDLPQTFELLPSRHGADATVRVRTPDDREAAMRRQPFELHGVTVMLVREGETGNVRRVSYNYMAHVALRDYPVEQRTEEHIAGNCARLGFVCEIDPACFAAPDLATLHVVLKLEHPREIPHQVRIGYFDGSKSVVPVEVVAVWDSAHSYDADGQYVRLFQAPAAAA